jgi:hypothetical protein
MRVVPVIPALVRAVVLMVVGALGLVAGPAAVAAPGDSSPDAYFGPAPQPSGMGMPLGFNPGPPTAPTQTIRPSGWPGAASADGANSRSATLPGGMPAAGYAGPGGSLPGVSIAPYQQPQPGEARLDGIAPIGSPAAGPGGPQGCAPAAAYGNNVGPAQAQYAPYSPAYAGAAAGQSSGSSGPMAQPSPSAENSNGSNSPAANGAAIEPCSSTQIFARVGSDVILAADVMPRINELLMSRLKDVSPEQLKQIPPQQLDAIRIGWAKQMLEEYVKIKLVYLDARQAIPKEHFGDVEQKVGDIFDKEEVPKIMERLKATSRSEMENKLRVNGTTLERERQAHLEKLLAMQWQLDKVKISKEISEDETVSYYHEHIKEFEHPAQARWEELMTRISTHPSRAAACDALAQMGNAVIHGASFAEVAKAHSEGTTASQGGQHDWTSRGSLVNADMDRALFGLRIGEMSQIMEDAVGFHIIRVVERKDVSRTPFTEAQVMIRKKIKEARTKRETAAYIDKLREQTPVWIASDLSAGLIPLPLPSGNNNPAVQQAARPAGPETQR